MHLFQKHNGNAQNGTNMFICLLSIWLKKLVGMQKKTWEQKTKALIWTSSLNNLLKISYTYEVTWFHQHPIFGQCSKPFPQLKNLPTLVLRVLQRIILTSKDKTFDVNKVKTYSKKPMTLLHIRITCLFSSKYFFHMNEFFCNLFLMVKLP
jgi:hypothetical protein